MSEKRIAVRTSRTAEWTCVSRAASSMESDPHYRSDDSLAVLLLPTILRLLLRLPPIRTLYKRVLTPKGIYEYVIARTKYIDAAFRTALAEQFDQVLIFGAGFDTRALRFAAEARSTKIFELDAHITQQEKLRQYERRHLTIPKNRVFVNIDFDQESLPKKLTEAGFRMGRRTLFLLEGVLMYLRPDSVDVILRTIRESSGMRSRVVFDYVHASVLRREGLYYGESEIRDAVAHAGEEWHFGIERNELAQFLARFGMQVEDRKCVEELEAAYFKDTQGRLIGHINGTHCLVTAEKY